MADETMASSSFEQRFNCLICWSPKLRMVFGLCQHRLCEDCLYNSWGVRRVGLDKCPTCQMDNAFPFLKPNIPEDNIAIQRQLGVVKCPYKGCGLEMWCWEQDEHLSECSYSKTQSKVEQSPKKRKKYTLRSSSQSTGYNLRSVSQRCSPGSDKTQQRKKRKSTV